MHLATEGSPLGVPLRPGTSIDRLAATIPVKDSYFAQVYRRLVGRRGVKKAIMAVAHRILIAVYYILLRHEPYRAPGAPVEDEQRTERLVNRMLQRIEKLGYTVSREPAIVVAT